MACGRVPVDLVYLFRAGFRRACSAATLVSSLVARSSLPPTPTHPTHPHPTPLVVPTPPPHPTPAPAGAPFVLFGDAFAYIRLH